MRKCHILLANYHTTFIPVRHTETNTRRVKTFKNNVQNSLVTSHVLNLTIEMFYISSILIKDADCLFSIE